MLKFTLLILIGSFMISSIYGQSLEEDNMVLYTKANVLFESGRYDEAIRMYNRILSDDEDHTRALFMRARTKYELGAYKGTKNDVLLFIDKAGVNKDIIRLMANTELQLTNLKAAMNYAKTGLELDPYDDKLHLIAGDISLESEYRNDACEHYGYAAQLGNRRAADKLDEYCLGRRVGRNQNRRQGGNARQKEDSPGEVVVEEPEVEVEERDRGGVVSLEEIVKEAEDEGTTNREERPRTTSIDKTQKNEIVIDDKLSITITDGIGHRTVVTKPSIFVLSDQDGTVVIDVCLDRDGRVSEAIFNRNESTIFRSSLTSLALRKAKSFVFSASSVSEQCGLMVFYIEK